MLNGKLSGPQFGRLVKFAVVGLSGVVVNLVVSELFFRVLLADLSEATYRLAVSNGIGVVVSIFTNFLLNDRWTWGDRKKGDRRAWALRLSKYYVSASVAGVLQVGISSLSYEFLFRHVTLAILEFRLDSTLSICTGIGAGMVINFVASHFWAFKDEEST